MFWGFPEWEKPRPTDVQLCEGTVARHEDASVFVHVEVEAVFAQRELGDDPASFGVDLSVVVVLGDVPQVAALVEEPRLPLQVQVSEARDLDLGVHGQAVPVLGDHDEVAALVHVQTVLVLQDEEVHYLRLLQNREPEGSRLALLRPRPVAGDFELGADSHPPLLFEWPADSPHLNERNLLAHRHETFVRELQKAHVFSLLVRHRELPLQIVDVSCLVHLSFRGRRPPADALFEPFHYCDPPVQHRRLPRQGSETVRAPHGRGAQSRDGLLELEDSPQQLLEPRRAHSH